MARTVSSYASGFPVTIRETLSAGGANVATQFTLPDVDYPVVVSIKPVTNAAKMCGAAVGLADGGSITADYDTLTADRWNKQILPGHIDGVAAPSFFLGSATTSTAVEVHIVPYVTEKGA